MSNHTHFSEHDESLPMTAAEVMNTDFRTCSRYSTAIEAVLIFKEEDCGMVPIIEDGKPIGVVTDRDIALALSENGDVAEQPLSEIMSEELVLVTQDTALDRVIRDFGRNGVRRVMVVDEEGSLVGIIAWADIVRQIPDAVMGQIVRRVVDQA